MASSEFKGCWWAVTGKIYPIWTGVGPLVTNDEMTTEQMKDKVGVPLNFSDLNLLLTCSIQTLVSKVSSTSFCQQKIKASEIK